MGRCLVVGARVMAMGWDMYGRVDLVIDQSARIL